MARKKLTTEQYIEKAKSVHGNKYIYDDTVYIGASESITIKCPEHGVFKMFADNHLQGSGCKICAGVVKLTTEEFISKAREVHGDWYDYSCSKSSGGMNKIDIRCPKHGIFSQRASDHLGGTRCRLCVFDEKKLSREQFIEKSKLLHGDRYDYSKVTYVGSSDYVIIVCPEHGEFEQWPTNHLQGQGCSRCNKTGFSLSKPAFLYVNRVGDVAIKYGITNNPPEERLREQSSKSSFPITAIMSFETSGSKAREIENKIKEKFGGKFLTKQQMVDGYTETICLTKLEELLKFLKEYPYSS